MGLGSLLALDVASVLELLSYYLLDAYVLDNIVIEITKIRLKFVCVKSLSGKIRRKERGSSWFILYIAWRILKSMMRLLKCGLGSR